MPLVFCAAGQSAAPRTQRWRSEVMKYCAEPSTRPTRPLGTLVGRPRNTRSTSAGYDETIRLTSAVFDAAARPTTNDTTGDSTVVDASFAVAHASATRPARGVEPAANGVRRKR